jgi:hypothetical protein
MASERMSRVDTAWLRMDNDVNLMMIVGVWLLTPAITVEALRQRMATSCSSTTVSCRRPWPTRWARTGCPTQRLT